MSTFMALKPQWLSRQKCYLKNALDKHIRQQHQLHCQRLRQTVASIYCENGCYESWHFILLQWNESLSTQSNYLKTEQIGHCILIWIQQHHKRMKINIWRKKETKRLAEGKKMSLCCFLMDTRIKGGWLVRLYKYWFHHAPGWHVTET